MADKTYDNSGVLFQNDRKEQPNHPDFKGNALVNGVEMWVSGWKKVGKNGKSFMSIAFRKKEATGQENQAQSGDDFF